MILLQQLKKLNNPMNLVNLMIIYIPQITIILDKEDKILHHYLKKMVICIFLTAKLY